MYVDFTSTNDFIMFHSAAAIVCACCMYHGKKYRESRYHTISFSSSIQVNVSSSSVCMVSRSQISIRSPYYGPFQACRTASINLLLTYPKLSPIHNGKCKSYSSVADWKWGLQYLTRSFELVIPWLCLLSRTFRDTYDLLCYIAK